nr:HAD-IA family hydrolase [Ancylobacter gelatini]
MDDVLLHYDVQARQSAIARMAGIEPEEVARRIWDSGIEDAADAGRLSAQAYLDAVAATLGIPFGEDDWLRTRGLAMTLTPDTIGLAAEVARRTPVALLTNNGHLMKTHFDTLVPELRAVFGPNMHVAAEFGTKKPDPAIFRRLAALYGAAPEQAVMIDDKEANTAGALDAGLLAHRFRAAGELDAYLRAHSLI